MCEGLLSYYSVSSSFSFLLFYFKHSYMLNIKCIETCTCPNFSTFFLVVYFHKINLLNAVVRRRDNPHAFFIVNERMWGHALMMIMSIKNILCTDLQDKCLKFNFFRIIFLVGRTFTSSPRDECQKALTMYLNIFCSHRWAFSFSFFLSSLSHKILLYALLHVIYNCRFQLHALRQNF